MIKWYNSRIKFKSLKYKSKTYLRTYQKIHPENSIKMKSSETKLKEPEDSPN